MEKKVDGNAEVVLLHRSARKVETLLIKWHVMDVVDEFLYPVGQSLPYYEL